MSSVLGNKIKQLRLERDLSQKELGQILGVSNVTISMYENNDRQPDSETIKKLADYFRVTTDYLLGRTENPDATVTLTEKNEKDIAKKMKKLREELSNSDGLMFDGEILSDETKDLLLALLEKDEIAATLNNKKYIPKKYRK